jgi:nitronate monooxygenase
MGFRTRITELCGIRYPIIQGGMQNVGYAELAAAVSNAGGLGMITALTFPSASALAAEIARCRAMTDAPFGVNISVFPTMRPPDYRGIVDVIADAGVLIVETAGTPAVREIWDMLFTRDIRVIHKCTSVRHALSSERYGIHAISIDGFECAGHPGEDDIPGLVLIPAAIDRLSIPVVASGGIADGRGLVAALALGAEGVNMGTRFCATQEAPIHARVKQAYVDGDERDTLLLFRPFRNSARVGRNSVAQEALRRIEQPGATFADVADLVSGQKGAGLLKSGDIESGIYWASMAQGLIHDVPTCEELISRMMADAKAIIALRLGAMLDRDAIISGGVYASP